MSVKLTKVLFTCLISLSFYSGISFAQIDTAAIVILDKMSDVVTGLESCSFTLKTEYDIYNIDLGLVKHSDEKKVFMKAPDKMMVSNKGDKGNKSLYYDGKTFTYYSADNNQYAAIPAPPTIMETIDSISNEYGVDFPAADLFYEDLVDNIMENADAVAYLGITEAGEKECHHVAGKNNEITFQLWINVESFLPEKLVIVYTNKPANPQYLAVFADWKLNPSLENSMFIFSKPKDAVEIRFSKKQL
ncbi:MAG: DUF2092 domain-containing protein [Ignavibacteriae bacterium]|nr:DUF2092 domain-containing protein [Ignavibacteriota bacterium]